MPVKAPEWVEGDEDERVRRSKKAVLAATFELLSEAGLGGASIDAIVRRSGVAKTTIYRHWPSRSALLLDACSRLGARPEIPDTGSFRGDLGLLVRQLAKQLASARWATIVPSIIDAAERESEIAEMHAGLHAGFMVPFVAAVERAQGRGEASPARDASEIVASIVGPLFYRRWFSRQRLDDGFVERLVDGVVAGAGRKP